MSFNLPTGRLSRRMLGVVSIAVVSMALQTAASTAQTYPMKPVRMIVPAPAGGTLDLVARAISDGLASALGQTVVVESKPGGAGMIGVQELLSSPHDGHTVMVHISGIVSEIPLVVKPPYDPFMAIKPLVELASSGLILVGAPNLPANNLQGVITYVKANPGKISYASYSAGTVSHTLGVELNAIAGLDMTHVAYKGSPPALQDIMGGHVQLMFDGAATSLALIKGEKVKAFAVTTPQRMPALPNVPTFGELEFPSLTQVAWVGLWTTPDVPPAVQEKLRAETLRILQKSSVAERIRGLGMEPGKVRSPDELNQALKQAYERQRATLQSANFKPE